ncbi:MAG: four helix bundle protein [Acidimicrobiia bacterium]
MRYFKRLKVWNRSHMLALAVYEATRRFPADERYGLRSQIRRSAVSIPSNIAEGAGRRSRRDYARFLDIAVGSASELEYQMGLGRDLGYISSRVSEPLEQECIEIRAMLLALRDRVLRPNSRLQTPDSGLPTPDS